VKLLLEFELWSISLVNKIIGYITLIICILGCLEFFSNNISNFFITYYSNPADVELIANQKRNNLTRAISTVGHPSTLGFICLVLISIALSIKNYIMRFPIICVALFAGIITYSKVFILGLFIVLFLYTYIFNRKYFFTKTLTLIFFIALSFIYIDLTLNDKFSFVLDVIVNGGIDGILNTRFGENGILNQQIDILKNTYFLGIGSDLSLGIEKTDSLFLTLIILCGFPGLLCLVIYWLKKAKKIFHLLGKKEISVEQKSLLFIGLTYIVIMLFVGIGYNSIFGERLLELSALILGSSSFLMNKIILNKL